MAHPRPATLEGRFQNVIYSPKGMIEGALLEIDRKPVQLVFDHHDEASPADFAALKTGQMLTVEASPRAPSDKGEAAHHVYDFARLVSVDGRKPKPALAAADAGYSGKVLRFNFARHGEANGVVLDTGHFIHTKPEGMARLKLKIGDRVRADGDAHWLATGEGWAVEAHTVNETAVRP